VIREGIQKLVNGKHLNAHEATQIMREIMSGEATQAQIGALLAALRMKGETVQEISAFAAVMREYSYRIHPKVSGRLVDTCGTGGDRVKTFNVSTASAFVVAGAGVTVAKHGNRSVTSRSGSADVLEELGYNISLQPERVERIIERIGIGFMFAPNFHPAMRHVTTPRREIGIRTIFNILGPLTNPAGVNAQLLGVYAVELLEPLARVLGRLGCEEAIVAHGVDGLDEISNIGKTLVAHLRDGKVNLSEIDPRDYGFKVAKPWEIEGGTPRENAEIVFKLLNSYTDSSDPRRDMVLLNSAAALMVGGKAGNLAEGIELARESIQSGAAYAKLRMMVKASEGDLSKLEEFEDRYA